MNLPGSLRFGFAFLLSAHALLSTGAIAQTGRDGLGAAIGSPLSQSRSIEALDLGIAPASTPVRRVQLVLARTPQQEQDLASLLADQQDKSSPRYHQWLTPSEFGAAFGPSDSDVARLTSWLNTQGFQNIQVSPGRTIVEFSGSAASLQRAFGTSIHQFRLGEKTAYAATNSPVFPAAIAPLVRGFASLEGSPAVSTSVSALMLRRDKATGSVAPSHPDNTIISNGSTYYGLTPYDFASLYDVLPLWNASIDGKGQTIAIVGDSDIHPADFVAFRTIFGLPLGNTDTATGTQYLNVIYNGNNPGIQPTEYHADSDTQWASAAAKGATIDYVASQSTEVSAGTALSASYIVNNNLASVLVDSYSSCEAQLGSGGNGFYSGLWQQAAAQGITVVTASGDSGAAGCDAFHTGPAIEGKAINGIASTPYDVAVGGTEFYAPGGLAQYFNATNDGNQASIKGYIPEIAWNDSCTNPAIDILPPYTGLSAEQVCNQAPQGSTGIVVTAGTGGGASKAGYVKPSWQSGPGVPADGVRDIPDVSLFASQGRTNSYYLVCQSDRDPSSATCNVNFPYSDFAAYGGTEVASPAFAGIVALAAQKAGGRIGLPNQVLYTLAAREASTSCDSTGTSSNSCIFHDITQGTNAMPCATGSPDCVTNTGGDQIGILSAPSASAGYDLASGLGSVDAANLVNAFSSVTFSPTSAIFYVTPSEITHGQAVTAHVIVSSANGTPTGEVTINSLSANGSVGGGLLSNGAFTQAFTNFPGGTYGVWAHYAGDSTFAPVDSNFVSLTVLAEDSTTTIQTLSINPVTKSATQLSAAPYGDIFYIRFNVQGLSGQGFATGDLDIHDSDEAYFGNGNLTRLNSSGYAEVQDNAPAPGTHTFTASYRGDPSFNPSTATPVTLVISQAPTTTSLSLSSSTASVGSTVTLSAVVGTQGYGYLPPTGTVTFSIGSTVLGTSNVLGGVNATTQQDQATATLTLSLEDFPVGGQQIVASYSGDSNYLASASSNTPLQVTPTSLTPTTTYVFPTPYSVAPNGNILYTALISPQTPYPTGTVQFQVDGNNVGAPQPVAANNYAAALQTTVAGLAIGLHKLTATYSGDGEYRSSNSQTSSFLITTPGVPSFVNFTANPTTLVQGTFITVNATVTPTSPVPTGTVQLVIDGGFYGTPVALSGNSAMLPLPTFTLQVGKHVLGVFYSGDGTYADSYAPPVNILINAPGATPSAVAITNLPMPVVTGTDAVFDAVVTPSSNPVPTGVLQIILDGGNPGLPILLTGATTKLTIPAASLPAGPHTVKVFYSGDNTYNFSTSSSYPFTVGTPVYVGDFTLTPASQSITLSRVSNSNGTTYIVTPLDGFNAPVTFSCSGLPANTSCTFTPATLTTDTIHPATTVLHFNLNTGLKGAAEPYRPFSVQPGIEVAGLFIVGLPFALRRRTSRGMKLTAFLLVSTTLAALSGCGGGVINLPGVTPLGTYNVVVTGTAPNATHTATITLTIIE